MTKYAENTQVPSDRSRAEIESTLRRYAHLIRFHQGGCWEWMGYIDIHGYGRASTGQRENAFAHRVIYAAFRGPVPNGLDLDHLCRHRCCVNPGHLEPVNRQENLLRGKHPNIIAHHANTCIRGHAMTPDNTYVSPKGQRHCRECRRIRDRERNQRYQQKHGIPRWQHQRSLQNG